MIDTIMNVFILSPYFWVGGIIGIVGGILLQKGDAFDKVFWSIAVLVIAGCGFMVGYTV